MLTLEQRIQAATVAAVQAGVTRRPDGRLQGPPLALYTYLEDMRRLGLNVLTPPVPPDPARHAAKAQRQAIERWRHHRKAKRG